MWLDFILFFLFFVVVFNVRYLSVRDGKKCVLNVDSIADSSMELLLCEIYGWLNDNPLCAFDVKKKTRTLVDIFTSDLLKFTQFYPSFSSHSLFLLGFEFFSFEVSVFLNVSSFVSPFLAPNLTISNGNCAST